MASFPMSLEVCLNASAESANPSALTPSASIRLITPQASLQDHERCSVVSEDALVEIQVLSDQALSDNVENESAPSSELATGLATGLSDDTVASPLERSPIRLLHLETANQLIGRALQLSFGSHQTLSDDNPGTGSQVYYGEIDWGITDEVQLSLSGHVYDDPPISAINGERQNITFTSLSASVRYRLLNSEQLALGVQGALETLAFSSDLFDSADGDANIVGAVHLPLTYTVSPDLQLHLTPGVSFLPGQLNGSEFYDTLFTVGSGVSWQPSEQWLLYGALNAPLGPGGNTIESDQDIDRQLVWSLGTRYNVTPRTGINLYATNGWGVTPATAILASVPGGDDLLLGVEVQYTPDTGLGYRDRFGDEARAPFTARDRQLMLDGITLANGHTLAPGNVAISAGAATQGQLYGKLVYSPDEALQFEFSAEDAGDIDQVIDDTTAINEAVRYAVGGRVQLLDQRLGDVVSLSARILAGRDVDDEVGVLFADLPLTYEVNSQLAVLVDPKIALSGVDDRAGLGLGVNYEVVEGLQLIGEVTPVFGGDRTIWALGTRYGFAQNGLSLELYGTNAVGRHGVGTLVGEDDARFGAGLIWVV
ncbi:MAG: hypothetical protein AAFU71_19940, partial [Cyanobacteria bacterium J06632_22]